MRNGREKEPKPLRLVLGSYESRGLTSSLKSTELGSLLAIICGKDDKRCSDLSTIYFTIYLASRMRL